MTSYVILNVLNLILMQLFSNKYIDLLERQNLRREINDTLSQNQEGRITKIYIPTLHTDLFSQLGFRPDINNHVDFKGNKHIWIWIST